ncbi:radical SAM protein [Maridesulfovibrio bastinii]|uniref:radical SAM protein n=1 Tax=Maridesulfovibrio bastinii TaxID=47157 RepID=UPI0004252B9C|nr:radical SAM protein [Maridesulfovibrio bastinii]
MAANTKPRPCLVFADDKGEIYDEPDLLMLCRRGDELALPRPDEYVPLPPESDFFMLPGRYAIGLDPETGEVEEVEGTAMAAFACPGYTLTGHAAYENGEDAPTLPLFAYGAVGYANGKFWITAKKVDEDKRQVFSKISCEKIDQGANKLMKDFPENRLIRHLAGCALTYGCPAAKNLALGRFEAPLPTSRSCNARCIGCISEQPDESDFPSTQNRIQFTPTVKEITEVMHVHAKHEKKPIFSFGQGCEGEPLTEAALLHDSIAKYRSDGGKGTININTNGSITESMKPLAKAGLSSIRVSLNSLRKEVYNSYYRPKGYSFDDVSATIELAKSLGVHVSLNYLFFPGISDTEYELEALLEIAKKTKLDFIQLRNLNLDPDLYMEVMEPHEFGPVMGFNNFRKRIKKECPWLKFGYFNPYLG